MEYLIKDIVMDARIRMNEVEKDTEDIILGDPEIDELIESRILEAVDYCHQVADISMMAGDAITETEATQTDNDGYAVCHGLDILKFVSARSDRWRRTVLAMCEDGSEEAVAALDGWVGASADRPAVICGTEKEGKWVMFVPTVSLSNPGKTGCKVRYIEHAKKQTGADGKECVTLDSALKAAMLNYLTGMVMITLNDDRGDNLIKLAANELGIE